MIKTKVYIGDNFQGIFEFEQNLLPRIGERLYVDGVAFFVKSVLYETERKSGIIGFKNPTFILSNKINTDDIHSINIRIDLKSRSE